MTATDTTTADQQPRWIEYLPLDDLPDHPRNPRDHDEAQLRSSVLRFGFTDPPMLDGRTGLLAEGHGRKKVTVALRAAGRPDDLPAGRPWPPEGILVRTDGAWLVPVVHGWRSADDTEAEAYLLAGNQGGGWHDDDLAGLLADLAATDAGLDGTGFDDGYLIDLASGDTRDDDTPAPNPPLADRFVVPPFSVLDARSGRWADRKARWMTLGIRSELGRDGGATLPSLSGRIPDYYAQKRRAEAAVGRELTNPEFEASHLVMPDGSSLGVGGTSVFDPVLAELAYRWFCPPAGLVLDPFAGGSVRGVIAAALGRRYVGIELRAEQIDANREQWATIGPRLAVAGPPPDFTPAVTPVERRGPVWVKRDDAWCRGGAFGAKSRAMFALVDGHAGIVTAGARTSPQIERAALTAAALGIGCRVHVPAGADTPEIATCLGAGAEIVRHRAGRLPVLRARFRDDAAARPDWLAVPFGMGLAEYVDDVAAQVADLPDGVRRIVVPTGSGATLAGVLRGLARAGFELPVVGVTVGHDPAEYLNAFAPDDWRDRVTLVASPLPFDAPAPGPMLDGLPLDSRYEAKCLPFLEPDDLLWCVGIRASEAGPGLAGRPAPEPRWIVGDSRRVLDSGAELPPGDGYDLLFSCPPYADLEQYSDDPADLANMPYRDFLAAYREIVRRAVARLAPDRFAVWVVGEVRDRAGAYRGLVPDTVRAFRDAGCAYHGEAILITPVGSVPIRAPRAFVASRSLGKIHQQVLVFVKGDAKRAAAACGPVEVTLDLPDR
jgi:hypothetical protein